MPRSLSPFNAEQAVACIAQHIVEKHNANPAKIFAVTMNYLNAIG
jgi:hypothetical protein